MSTPRALNMKFPVETGSAGNFLIQRSITT